MLLEQKPLSMIEESDLQRLVDSSVAEQKTIEYKSALPGDADDEKKKFLANVSSFANASGGHLIFGIEAKDGVPTNLNGLEVPSADKAVLRLDDMVRAGIRARIPGHNTQPVTLSNGRIAIVMRIPHSWNAPHMVTYKDWSRFYARNSNGKYLLDVGEIRAAFLRSETTADRIRRFRTDRLTRIIAGEFPTRAPLADAPKLILHIAPLGAFDAGISVDVARCIEDGSFWGTFPPLGGARQITKSTSMGISPSAKILSGTGACHLRMPTHNYSAMAASRVSTLLC
jgi:schlafen family protein